MNDALLFEKNGRIATLTINRPHNRNPLGVAGDGDLFEDAAHRINQDPELRCVVMTGAGKAFSAGGDLKALRDKADEFSGPQIELREHYRTAIHGIVRAMWRIEVPIVGAINGPAVGLGNDVAALCDIRIASEEARFGATFLKIGLIPGDGGAWLLPRIIGWSRAAQLFFTGDLIDARTALEWGLVSAVVPAAALMDEAYALAARIAAQPPQALRMTKKLMRDGLTSGFEAIMETSAAYQVILQHTDDHLEALHAFFEKRAPEFKGR